MKKIFLFICLVYLPTMLIGQSFKQNKEELILFLLENIGENFHVEDLNNKKNRDIYLYSIYIRYETISVIYDENDNKIDFLYKEIRNIEDIDDFKIIDYIDIVFYDLKTNEKYLNIYLFNHNNKILDVEFTIKYKEKTINGKKKRLNYLYIETI